MVTLRGSVGVMVLLWRCNAVATEEYCCCYGGCCGDVAMVTPRRSGEVTLFLCRSNAVAIERSNAVAR